MPAAVKVLSIDGFPIDATISESHTMSTRVTSYPMETGSQVSDHMRRMPREVTMEVLVSDTPLTNMKTFREAGTSPSAAALDHLEKMWEAEKLVHVVSALRTYENMAVTNIEISKSKDKTGGLWFTVTMEQAQVVTNDRVRRTDVPRCQGGRTKGLLDGPTAKSLGLGSPILWRKGNPPGSDTIYGTEFVYYSPGVAGQEGKTAGYYRNSGNGPVLLSNQSDFADIDDESFVDQETQEPLSELDAFARDMERDRRAREREGQQLREDVRQAVEDRKRQEALRKAEDDFVNRNAINRSKPPTIPKKWGGRAK